MTRFIPNETTFAPGPRPAPPGTALGVLAGVLDHDGQLPWHQLVVLPEPESGIAETAAALATTRAIQSV